MPEPNIMINVPAGSGIDPMSSEELEAFRENAPECSRGALWSLLDWSLWGAGMADVFREPLANTMLAAVPNNVCRHAEAIMADFKQRRGITRTGVDVYHEQRDEIAQLRETAQNQARMIEEITSACMTAERERDSAVAAVQHTGNAMTKVNAAITQAMRLAAAGDAAGAAAVLGDVAPDGGDLDG